MGANRLTLSSSFRRFSVSYCFPLNTGIGQRPNFAHFCSFISATLSALSSVHIVGRGQPAKRFLGDQRKSGWPKKSRSFRTAICRTQFMNLHFPRFKIHPSGARGTQKFSRAKRRSPYVFQPSSSFVVIFSTLHMKPRLEKIYFEGTVESEK